MYFSLQSQKENILRGRRTALGRACQTMNVRTGFHMLDSGVSMRSSLLHRFPDVSEEVEQGGRPIAFARCEPQERLRSAGAF